MAVSIFALAMCGDCGVLILAPPSFHGCQDVFDKDMWQHGSSESFNCTPKAVISDASHHGASSDFLVL